MRGIRVQKGRQDRVVEPLTDHKQGDGEPGNDPVGDSVAMFHPLSFSGSQILCRKGGHGVAGADHGNNGNGFQAHAGRVAGQGRGAELIYGGLGQKHADADNGLLNNGRNGDPCALHQDGKTKQAGLFLNNIGVKQKHQDPKRDNC